VAGITALIKRGGKREEPGKGPHRRGMLMWGRGRVGKGNQLSLLKKNEKGPPGGKREKSVKRKENQGSRGGAETQKTEWCRDRKNHENPGRDERVRGQKEAREGEPGFRGKG